MDPQLTTGQWLTIAALPPPWRMEFDELAAFLEYDCGLHRGRAEVLAYYQVADRLDPVPLVPTLQSFYPDYRQQRVRRRAVNVCWVALSWRGLLLRRDIWRLLTVAQWFSSAHEYSASGPISEPDVGCMS